MILSSRLLRRDAMVKVMNIDHVAIAVPDAAKPLPWLEGLFDLRRGAVEPVPGQKTDVVFLSAGTQANPGGATAVELICPSGNEGLQKFIDKRGPGLHHICFEVADLALALADLKAAGVALIDETPRPGARGHQVAFIHPKATGGVLLELCQKGTRA